MNQITKNLIALVAISLIGISQCSLPVVKADSFDNKNDEGNLRQRQLQTASFKGTFTLVRANMAQTASSTQILLQTYPNGGNYDINKLAASKLSLNVDVTGVFTKVVFEYNGTTFEDTTAPYGMSTQLGNQYAEVPYIQTPGAKLITVKGFSGKDLKAKLDLKFTVVDTDPMALGQWVVTSSNAKISKRHENCFVMVNRTAVMIGGRGPQNPEIYNPVTRQWTVGAAPPGNIQLHHMQCVVVKNKIWIVAAWTDNYPKEVPAPFVYSYDPVANKWETKNPMPEKRRRGAAAAVAVGDAIYVAFGNIGGHETGNHALSVAYLDVYNTKTDEWKELTSGKYPRDHVGGSLMQDGRICFAGGRDGGTLGWPSVVPTECYDIAAKKWMLEADVPNGRGGASYGTSCDGRLLMAGGEMFNPASVSNKFDVFDGKRWRSLSTLNIARHSTGLAVDCVCNAIYIASGSNTAGDSGGLTSVETFFMGGKDTPCKS